MIGWLFPVLAWLKLHKSLREIYLLIHGLFLEDFKIRLKIRFNVNVWFVSDLSLLFKLK